MRLRGARASARSLNGSESIPGKGRGASRYIHMIWLVACMHFTHEWIGTHTCGRLPSGVRPRAAQHHPPAAHNATVNISTNHTYTQLYAHDTNYSCGGIEHFSRSGSQSYSMWSAMPAALSKAVAYLRTSSLANAGEDTASYHRLLTNIKDYAKLVGSNLYSPDC